MKRLPTFAIMSYDANALAAPNEKPIGKRVHSIIAYLAGSCALMMTGFGIATPVFARRLSELGAGVEVLSMMAMASALAQFLLAPLMGSLADRFGRRRTVLLALSGLAITNLAFLVARSSGTYIVLRFLQGAFSVGMLPAVMSMVADLVPEKRRTRWVGVIMGGYAVGFTFGPVIGGLLFAWWGFTAPQGVAALMDLLALFIAYAMVPETREAAIFLKHQRNGQELPGQRELAASLPHPRSFFAVLLLLDFIAAFGMAFIEPQMVFYLYNTLSWTTTQYGLMMGGYGVATLVGQVALGQLSNHFGGKLILALGFLFNSALSLGLLLFHQFSQLALAALFAGLGSAFITTRLGVCYLDITTPQHRSVALGIRESAISLGAVAGPLLATFVSRWLVPQGIFTMAALTQLSAVILALVVLKPQSQANEPARAVVPVDTGEQVSTTIPTTCTMAKVA
jgi:MFS family permease